MFISKDITMQEPQVTLTISCRLEDLPGILERIRKNSRARIEEKIEVGNPAKPNGNGHIPPEEKAVEKPRKKITCQPKPCSVCGEIFQPSGPRSLYCDKCKKKPPADAELEKTLREIEANRKKPYEFK